MTVGGREVEFDRGSVSFDADVDTLPERDVIRPGDHIVLDFTLRAHPMLKYRMVKWAAYSRMRRMLPP
jgi:hypothetical protein